ncbi:MAG: DegT/DnrJ/EryC1/StrS family aminotransferase [Caldilineaceae bacterium]|nr:DegT/DnrJ/EryC1/StrS family aminotransferase [Caldilineaceae bacterium]
MTQPIPLVDLHAQYIAIRTDIDQAIQQVIDTTSFIMGPAVRHFEDAFAAFCGTQHCVGVSNGTAALALALRALGIGPGAEVITASHTFIATAEAISNVGATPVFVDIDPVTYTIDPAAAATAITPQTRALLPVHLYGQPAAMTALKQLAQAHGLAVIEDAAQAHGATWQGNRAGNLADIACFSFYPGKNLGAYGDAGAITTNDATLAESVRLLRNHGRRSKYVHDLVGANERIDTLQAAILAAKLPYLATWIAQRQALAARYHTLLADAEVERPLVAPDATAAWHLYVIRTPQRDALLTFLKEHAVEAGIHYPVPLHLQPAYANLGYRRGDLPVTEAVADSCLSLPLYPEMSEAQQDRVVELIYTFLEQNR